MKKTKKNSIRIINFTRISRKHYIYGMISLIILLSLLFSLTVFRKEDSFKIIFLDTGKSDSILILMDDAVIMNDTADEEDYPYIARVLRENHIKRIDYMILSHYDNDHIGSAYKIIDNFQVDYVIDPNYSRDSRLYKRLQKSIKNAYTTEITLGEDYHITTDHGRIIINAPNQNVYKNENNYSLICSVSYDKYSFLLTGDSLKKRIMELEENMDSSYTLIKLPHHGSSNKELLKLIQNTKLQYAVVCAADDSTVDEEVVQLLKKKNVKLYYTYNGEIEIAIKDGLRVKQK